MSKGVKAKLKIGGRLVGTLTEPLSDEHIEGIAHLTDNRLKLEIKPIFIVQCQENIEGFYEDRRSAEDYVATIIPELQQQLEIFEIQEILLIKKDA